MPSVDPCAHRSCSLPFPADLCLLLPNVLSLADDCLSVRYKVDVGPGHMMTGVHGETCHHRRISQPWPVLFSWSVCLCCSLWPQGEFPCVCKWGCSQSPLPRLPWSLEFWFRLLLPTWYSGSQILDAGLLLFSWCHRKPCVFASLLWVTHLSSLSHLRPREKVNSCFLPRNGVFWFSFRLHS